MVFGVIAALGTLACGLLTKECLKPVRAEKFSFKPFADLIKNKPWIYLTLVGICTNFFNGFRYAVASFMFDYILGKEITFSRLIINYTVFMTFGEVTCMIFGGLSPKFTQWMKSKRKAFIVAAFICLAFSTLFFFMPKDPAYIWLLIAIVVLTSVGIGLYSPLLWSMYADVADYATERNGTSSTGLIFSSGTMAQKFGTAISGSLLALLLGLVGFSSGTSSVNEVIIPTDNTITIIYKTKDGKESTVTVTGKETTEFIRFANLEEKDVIAKEFTKITVTEDGMRKVKNRIWALSEKTSLISSEKDKYVTTIIKIEKMGEVRDMIWLIFSLFPAFIALIMLFLIHKYPIKK